MDQKHAVLIPKMRLFGKKWPTNCLFGDNRPKIKNGNFRKNGHFWFSPKCVKNYHFWQKIVNFWAWKLCVFELKTSKIKQSRVILRKKKNEKKTSTWQWLVFFTLLPWPFFSSKKLKKMNKEIRNKIGIPRRQFYPTFLTLLSFIFCKKKMSTRAEWLRFGKSCKNVKFEIIHKPIAKFVVFQ